MATTTKDPKAAALRLVAEHAKSVDKEIARRDRVIVGVHRDGLASLRELADVAGVSHQTIANIIERDQKARS